LPTGTKIKPTATATATTTIITKKSKGMKKDKQIMKTTKQTDINTLTSTTQQLSGRLAGVKLKPVFSQLDASLFLSC